MADIDVERKGPSIWPWIIGLLVLALLIWAIAEMVDTEEPEVAAVDTEVAEEVQPLNEPAPEPVAQAGGIAVSDIIESPANWTGQTVNGEVSVTEVPTDRGFWIEDQGERLFAVIVDRPNEEPLDISAGQTLRLTEAVVRDPSYLSNIEGRPLDADTENIAREESVFLVVDEGNIERVGETAGVGGDAMNSGSAQNNSL